MARTDICLLEGDFLTSSPPSRLTGRDANNIIAGSERQRKVKVMEGPAKIVSFQDVPEDTQHGGVIRVLLSPAIAGTTSGTMGICILKPGETLAEHRHSDSEEMFYITNGSCVVSMDGVNYRAEAGQAVLIPKNVRHSLHSTGKGNLVIVFSNSFVPPRSE